MFILKCRSHVLAQLGSCSLSDVAVTVQTRIVAAFPDRNEIIIDAGFTALGEQGFEELGRSYAWVKVW